MQIDIFSIPLYYISFNKNKELEKKLNDVGFTNINHFKAVNGKQFDPLKLKRDNMITIRTLNDLNSNRNEFSGIPSLGAVGCTLSHYELWSKCMNDLDYIIIVEDDVKVDRNITEKELNIIRESITKKNGGFISPMFNSKFVWGTHFYICSKGMCKKLVENAFPIDVQTDAYISNLSDLKEIDVKLQTIYGQKKHYSSIQDLCIKCLMPNSPLFYAVSSILVFVLIYFCVKCYKRCFGKKCL